MNRSIAALGLTLLFAAAGEARADWSLNFGYQNPIVSTYGLNFLYMGSQWCFETGIGWVDVNAKGDDDDDKDDSKKDDDGARASVHLAGDADVKYLFSSGTVKPFVQGGFGVGIGAAAGDNSGASAGAGGGFAGLGLFIGGKSAYGYASFNGGGGGGTFVQAGLGFDI